MSSINGEEYKRKYGIDHEKAANDWGATKIYVYRALLSSELPETYKIINSDQEESLFLNSPFVYEPKLIWVRRREE